MLDDVGPKRISSFMQLTPTETRTVVRQAAEETGSLVRSTLGPFGLDKLVVRRQQDGELRGFVSNDGIAIIEEFEGETQHPVAQHFIETTEAQEDDYGDGTTTTVLLASELLKTGVDLIEEGVAPTTVVDGFSIAAQRTLETWQELSVPLMRSDGQDYDRELLAEIARVGMTNGSDRSWSLNPLSDQVVEAVFRVAGPSTGGVDLSYVRTETMPGQSVEHSTVIEGGLLPTSLVHETIDLPLEGPLLLVDGTVDPHEFEGSSSISAVSGDTAANLRRTEEHQYDRLVAAIEATGAVAVLATGNVAQELAVRLTSRGIATAEDIKKTRIQFLSRVIGSSVTPSLVSPDMVPAASTLQPARVSTRYDQSGKHWLKIIAVGDVESTAVTFLVCGGSESVASEAERRIKDGLNAVRAAIMRPEGLPGGGAAEMAAAASVRNLASGVEGRTQLAIKAYADVLESIARTLARNAGLDSIDAILDLRKRHHEGQRRAGISVEGAVVNDVLRHGALDPQLVRTSALVRSTEFVNSHLRVDSILYQDYPSSPFAGTV